VRRHGRQRRPQFFLGGHVHYRVVDEHRVEGAAEPNGAHVAGYMLALGVERAAQLTQLLGRLNERQGEGVLHVGGVVTAAAAELEHLANRATRCALNHLDVQRRLLGVFRGWRDDRPLICKAVVELLCQE
jgi:hypothetical protein